jgi:hypothetical protein
MNREQLMKIVEQYCRKSDPVASEIKVVRIPDQKTTFIEQHGESGRSIDLTEHQVDGKTYWAGYSSYSETVYISQAA